MLTMKSQSINQYSRLSSIDPQLIKQTSRLLVIKSKSISGSCDLLKITLGIMNGIYYLLPTQK